MLVRRCLDSILFYPKRFRIFWAHGLELYHETPVANKKSYPNLQSLHQTLEASRASFANGVYRKYGLTTWNFGNRTFASSLVTEG